MSTRFRPLAIKNTTTNKSENSFELYLEPPDNLDGLHGDSLYEAQVKYKTKMLGNIKLVGVSLSIQPAQKKE